MRTLRRAGNQASLSHWTFGTRCGSAARVNAGTAPTLQAFAGGNRVSARAAPRSLGVGAACWVALASSAILGLSACSGGSSAGGSGTGGSSAGESPSAETTESTSRPESETRGLSIEQAAAPLATIGDRTITVGEFAELLESKGPFLRARYASAERRRELLDQLVRFELLAQEAERSGYFDHPDVERTRKQTLIRQYIRQEFEDRIQLTDVSEQEIASYYATHPGEFERPEQVRASVIAVRDRTTAQRILRQLTDSDDPRLFRELAERHNIEPALRDRFGDVGFFSARTTSAASPTGATGTSPTESGGAHAGQSEDGESSASSTAETGNVEADGAAGESESHLPVPPAVAQAAFAIPQVGGIAPELVAADSTFFVVKLTGRRAAQTRTLEQVSRAIRHRLWRARRQEALESMIRQLRAEADVEQHLELLSEVRVPVAAEAAASH